MNSIYLETSIISYLVARPSRDIRLVAHQQITKLWWDTRRRDYELFVSPSVIHEAKAGDPEAARRRWSVLEDLPVLGAVPETGPLAKSLLTRHALPPTAEADAVHIAMAATNGMDFLLTWNFKHIANAEKLPTIQDTIRRHGFEPPTICTPEELLGGWHEE